MNVNDAFHIVILLGILFFALGAARTFLIDSGYEQSKDDSRDDDQS